MWYEYALFSFFEAAGVATLFWETRYGNDFSAWWRRPITETLRYLRFAFLLFVFCSILFSDFWADESADVIFKWCCVAAGLVGLPLYFLLLFFSRVRLVVWTTLFTAIVFHIMTADIAGVDAWLRHVLYLGVSAAIALAVFAYASFKLTGLMFASASDKLLTIPFINHDLPLAFMLMTSAFYLGSGWRAFLHPSRDGGRYRLSTLCAIPLVVLITAWRLALTGYEATRKGGAYHPVGLEETLAEVAKKNQHLLKHPAAKKLLGHLGKSPNLSTNV